MKHPAEPLLLSFLIESGKRSEINMHAKKDRHNPQTPLNVIHIMAKSTQKYSFQAGRRRIILTYFRNKQKLHTISYKFS